MDFVNVMVAPLVGAWIERFTNKFLPFSAAVAPLVGAWIESEKEEKMLFDLCGSLLL